MPMLDHAFAKMQAAPENTALRRAYYQQLADTEIYIPVADVTGESFTPETFDLDLGATVLAFDSPERLADFLGTGHDFVALPARVLIPLLVDQRLLLLINPDSASANLLPRDVLIWVQDVVAAMPSQAVAGLTGLCKPGAATAPMVAALDRAFGQMPGAATQALLFDSDQGLTIAFTGAAETSHPALAKAVQDALVFAGVDADCSVVFLSDTQAQSITPVALAFDLPKPVAPPIAQAPGTDPDKPPKLR